MCFWMTPYLFRPGNIGVYKTVTYYMLTVCHLVMEFSFQHFQTRIYINNEETLYIICNNRYLWSVHLEKYIISNFDLFSSAIGNMSSEQTLSLNGIFSVVTT